MLVHLLAVIIALIADRFIGDPPNWPHPVRWIGSLIMFSERRMNRGKHRKLNIG
ncbi:cobalamin biosynthesis protein [Jeotgalibacillus marinus]|uniref:Cobalamin biosynthesis protein n=1 Tax=Jeotgalibacillus marinus TaxID=86667 RepID=A0ABV3Q1C0_9BACL